MHSIMQVSLQITLRQVSPKGRTCVGHWSTPDVKIAFSSLLPDTDLVSLPPFLPNTEKRKSYKLY